MSYQYVNHRLIDVDAIQERQRKEAEEPTAPEYPPVALRDVEAVRSACLSDVQGDRKYAALERVLVTPPYGGDDAAKDRYLEIFLEVLNSVKSAEVDQILSTLSQKPASQDSPSGVELMDVLMKYIYKGMGRLNNSASNAGVASPVSTHATGASTMSGLVSGMSTFGIGNRPSKDDSGMSVLLGWHEKVVNIAGHASIIRVMTDRRTV
ncbi:actin-related protein 2/3 complex subunit 5 [Pyronema domesticum]|uniref:Actin-related protein 2/3 complex subunit 5 n=1 Tax=Pyronema omphalodes (strain CBS 100304) TaxID=1076935 RepID=U4LK47_PYROM|nr:actin-related protein 2/3 complex subunit 5 [Pyronema domesticum]CCX29740.1 Similar to Actin-related protein 2/3 complex subunit 5; acc. no. P40518 [Pyronema omphalodes CBS 100304]